MQGSVKIRPIKTAEFDSEYTIGYEIANSVLSDNLSTYEMYCIKKKKSNMRTLKRQKGREIQRNFWTPDYCFIGSLLTQEDSVSLKEISLMLAGDKQKMKAKSVSKNFNKSIPNKDKNYYYHYQLKTANKAVMIYLKGVKFVAAVLYHHEHLKRVGDIEEFLAMSAILNESGMAGLMSSDVVTLMSGYQQCYHFQHHGHDSDFIATSKDKLPLSIKAATEFYENNFNPQAHSSTNYKIGAFDDDEGGSQDLELSAPTSLSIEKNSHQVDNKKTISLPTNKAAIEEANTTTFDAKDTGGVSVEDIPDETPSQLGWRDMLDNNSRSAKSVGKEIRTPSREGKEDEVISEDYVETGTYLQEMYKNQKGDK